MTNEISEVIIMTCLDPCLTAGFEYIHRDWHETLMCHEKSVRNQYLRKPVDNGMVKNTRYTSPWCECQDANNYPRARYLQIDIPTYQANHTTVHVARPSLPRVSDALHPALGKEVD